MKKRSTIILCIIAGVTVSAMIFAGICVGTSDFSSKASYLQNAFEVEKPYFTTIPSDKELKELFNKNKSAFHQLAKMAQEDKVSSLRKNCIFHNDSSMSMVFFPYILGEFPSDKIISRERFFKYLALMKECKIQDFGCEYDDERIDHPIQQEQTESESSSDEKDTTNSETKGYQFFIFEDYNYDNVPKDKFLSTKKHIHYYRKDDEIEFVSDTDSLENLDQKKSTLKAAFVKLEPNWVIKKSISLENENPSSDGDEMVKSKDGEK